MRETITPIKWLRWRFSLGEEVNLIPQLFGGAQYPRPGVGRDAAVVAQRPGHHCPGDSRSPGNILAVTLGLRGFIGGTSRQWAWDAAALR